MFNFTTNVIINSADQFTTDAAKKELRVKRYRDFYGAKDGETVKSIYKAVAYDGKKTKAEVAADVFTALEGAIPAGKTNMLCRVSVYVKLQGSNNPLYANDFVFKGKPFSVEFLVKDGDTAAIIANRVVLNLKKVQSMLMHDPILEVSADAGKLTLNAINENQRIFDIKVEKYVEDPEIADGVFETVYSLGTLKTVDPKDGTTLVTTYMEDGKLLVDGNGAKVAVAPTGAGNIVVEQGIEGFGTYTHLMKDYRLPTQANLRWLKIDEDNYPIKGVKYNQYTIKYETDRGITGQSVVGQPGSSITTHIFWVAQGDVATAFETGLANIGWSSATPDAVFTDTILKDGVEGSNPATTAKTSKNKD